MVPGNPPDNASITISTDANKSDVTISPPRQDSKLFRLGEDLIPPLSLALGFAPVLKKMLNSTERAHEVLWQLKRKCKRHTENLILPDFTSISDI